MKDMIVKATVELNLNCIPDSFDGDDVHNLVADIIVNGEQYVNETWAAKDLMWHYSKVDPVEVLKEVEIPEPESKAKVKNYCPYCGLDFREIDWGGADIMSEDHCPNCGGDVE